MDRLSINFVDFWPNFQKADNYFYHLLSTAFEVSIDEETPDILFHSVDYNNQQKHRKYDDTRTKKVFYTGENVRPNYDETHFSLSFDFSDDDRNYRLPLWALYLNWFNVPHNELRDQSYLHPLDDFLNKRIDGNQIREEIEQSLSKENLISEQDKILLFKLYLKIKEEFKNLDKSKL